MKLNPTHKIVQLGTEGILSKAMEKYSLKDKISRRPREAENLESGFKSHFSSDVPLAIHPEAQFSLCEVEVTELVQSPYEGIWWEDDPL